MIKRFNPKQSKDPIALKTQWTPIFSGSSGDFRVKRLSEETNGKIEFKSKNSSSKTYKYTIYIGIVVLIFTFYMGGGLIPLKILSAVSIGLGCWGLYLNSQPLSFDKTSGTFKRGKKEIVKFDDIYALQIISREVITKARKKGQVKKFKTFELNAILNDGNRSNIVAHSSINEMRQDAERISKFLDKPLWDASI